MFKIKLIAIGAALSLIACSQEASVDINTSKEEVTTQVENREASTSDLSPYHMPETHVVPIRDSKADRPYELYIKLPKGYEKNKDQTYPVIYITDGNWQMDMLSGSAKHLMPKAILVGISWQTDYVHKWGEHVSRFRDYTFVKDKDAPVETGEAAHHLSFIQDDVFNYIESTYRADPRERTYFGYSTGGAFGAYIIFEKPEVFKNYILGSPAFGPKHKNVLDALEAKMALSQEGLEANVFVSIGELETSEMAHTETFVSMLERKRQLGLSFNGLEVIEDADHGTAFPDAVIRSLKWVAPPKSE